MALLKRLWIPITLIALVLTCAVLVSFVSPYKLLANRYNPPTLPPQRFDAKKWPKKPYTEQKLPIRQSMSESIEKTFKPGLTRREIEQELGPPDREETDRELLTGNERDQNFAKGDTAISYIVFQDFASGPFTLCFVFDVSGRLKKLFYRWG
jgi:hypothetical protein